MFALQALATKHADMKIVCSPIRYAAVVKRLLEKHKDIGFKGLLHMHPVHLRRMMLVGLAKNYDIGMWERDPYDFIRCLSYYGSEHRRQNNRHK
jgi:hypothetical protein